MREFFHGWRRKAGVAALVIACVLMGAWVRSRIIEDVVFFLIGKTTPVLLFSTQGYIVWGQVVNLDLQDPRGHPPHWSTETLDPRSGSRQPLFSENPGFTWRWWICAVVEDVTPLGRFSFFIISYWSLIMPLSVLSAYLILWTPRKRVVRAN